MVESRLKAARDVSKKKHEHENDATKKLQAFKNRRTSIQTDMIKPKNELKPKEPVRSGQLSSRMSEKQGTSS